MPRKERPAPLADGIFKAKFEQRAAQQDADEEIPVHNTFIQFGYPSDDTASGKQHMSTAPAWIGGSLQVALRSAANSNADASGDTHEEGSDSKAEEAGVGEPRGDEFSSLKSPKKLASPKKVPVMRYAMSSSSARAAGLTSTSSGAVVASYGPEGGHRAEEEDEEEGEEEEGEEEEGNETNDNDSEAERVRAAVADGEFPSLGSAKHAEGLCKRCCFFPKGRCLNGRDCEFCHLEHEKRKRKKKKKKRGATHDNTDSDEDDLGPYSQEAGMAANGSHSMQHVPGLQANLSSRSGMPLTAPPPLPPKGLPMPSEPLPPGPAGIYGQGFCHAGVDPALYPGAYGIPPAGARQPVHMDPLYGHSMGAAFAHMHAYAMHGVSAYAPMPPQAPVPTTGGAMAVGQALPPPR